jgi:hypothetical protein
MGHTMEARKLNFLANIRFARAMLKSPCFSLPLLAGLVHGTWLQLA